jgi:murein DD-endopeptidase MepM/ murein hydrolase activator NlpD
MLRRLVLPLVAAALVATPAGAQSIQSRKESVDGKIAALNTKIAAARDRERALSEQIAVVSAKIRKLEREVGDVASDLAVLEHDLALQQEKLARITELWHLQVRKHEFLKRQHAAALDRLHARLVAIYEEGEIGTLEVLLDSESFSDLISRIDYVREVAEQDDRIAAEVGAAKVEMRIARARTKKTRQQVARVTRAVKIRTEQQRAIRNELVASRDSLAGARGDKERTLESVQENKEEYLAEVAALAQVSSQLAARIQAVQGSSTSVPTVPSSSGFIWPVSGPVTSPFGWRWGRMHEGIDIAAPSGSPIRAAAAGVVIHAGWMGGYGNLVVLDHGGGLATAYAHASSIIVGNGQSVAQGQTLSYVGCTGHCFGPHLHFEVRVNGAPVDPLGYL